MKTLCFKPVFYSYLFIAFLLWSCSEDSGTTTDPPPEPPYQPTLLSAEVTDLFVTDGNPDADTVWIYEQGGPSASLSQQDLQAFPNYSDQLNVYIHQVLTYNNDLHSADLSLENAQAETEVNTEILDRVITHFTAMDKRVVVIGHSYGAYVTTKYLADKGSAAAELFVIMAGRLDIEATTYEGLIEGTFYHYPDFTTPTVHPSMQPENNGHVVELLLLGAIAEPRYTQRLNDVDLSNVVYVYAQDDTAVGRLAQAELNFLNTKGVEIVTIENGGHTAMFEAPHNQTIYTLMTE